RGVEVLEPDLALLVGDLEVPPRDLVVAETEVRLQVPPDEEGHVLPEEEGLSLVLPFLDDEARHSGSLPIFEEDLFGDALEERSADADDGRPLLDGDLEVVRHAHGEAAGGPAEG